MKLEIFGSLFKFYLREFINVFYIIIIKFNFFVMREEKNWYDNFFYLWYFVFVIIIDKFDYYVLLCN